MKKEIVALILAGGRGTRLETLTENIAKPAVYFGGKYRIIDFPLSNCANSGIDIIGVLTQYESVLLGSYIGYGKKWGFDGKYSLAVNLPARERNGLGTSWYEGTANAVYQNITFLEQYEPEYVLILSGDHVYKMNYSGMLEAHKKKNADATIAVFDVSMEEASSFGIMSLDEEQWICDFEEKPQNPKSTLASMGIYIFNYQLLKEYLIADAKNPKSEHDFGKNIIPTMLADNRKLYGYTFDGYWRDVGTVNSLWQANMDLLYNEGLDIHHSQKDWKIHTEDPLEKPQIIGEDANIKNALISQGCYINGEVSGSVLFYGVTVQKGAKVIDAVIMPGVIVEEGAEVYKCIVGEKQIIPRKEVINYGQQTVKLITS